MPSIRRPNPFTVGQWLCRTNNAWPTAFFLVLPSSGAYRLDVAMYTRIQRYYDDQNHPWIARLIEGSNPTMVDALCAHCGRALDMHGGNQCLFAPTKFKAADTNSTYADWVCGRLTRDGYTEEEIPLPVASFLTMLAGPYTRKRG